MNSKSKLNLEKKEVVKQKKGVEKRGVEKKGGLLNVKHNGLMQKEYYYKTKINNY